MTNKVRDKINDTSTHINVRKLIVSMNVTLDGFMARPGCELDWHFQSWTSQMAQFVSQQLSKAETVLLGRVTYCAMAKYWTSKAIDLTLAREDMAFAEMMNQYNKTVFSKTLTTLYWHNLSVGKRDIVEAILQLKRQPGKDMMIDGSGSLVWALMQQGLVDQYQIWVHPVLLGKGKPFFKNLSDTHCLTLLTTRRFGSGVVLLHYALSGKTYTSGECV